MTRGPLTRIGLGGCALLWALGSGCTDPCRTPGTVCSVAGVGAAGSDESEDRATRSPLYGPMDVVVWTGPDDFFIGDWNNHKIRHVQDGIVQTIVGTDFLGDGDSAFQERVAPGVPGTQVALNHPTQMEWNPVTGKLLIPSWHNHRVREWTPETGNSLVVAADTDITDGNGANAGFAGDGGPAADALMSFPQSIAIDPLDGSFWLLTAGNLRIRKVAADYSLIDTIAGTGSPGYSGDGADALDATFHFWDADDRQPEPAGSIEYADRTLFIVDTSNHAIRVMDLDTGLIDTLPNTGTQTLPGGECDSEALCFPRDLEVGPDGRLWIADTGNHVIRMYDLESETLTTAAGTFSAGDGEDGLPALDVSLNGPHGIDLAEDGTLLIADTFNHRIRRMTP